MKSLIVTLLVMFTTSVHAMNIQLIEDYCGIVSEYTYHATLQYHSQGHDARKFRSQNIKALLEELDSKYFDLTGNTDLSRDSGFIEFNNGFLEILFTSPRISKHIEASLDAAEMRNVIYINCYNSITKLQQ